MLLFYTFSWYWLSTTDVLVGSVPARGELSMRLDGCAMLAAALGRLGAGPAFGLNMWLLG